MPNVPASGWWATVTHPDTDRTLRADPLSDPRIEPSINALPRIFFPTPRSPQWQDLDTALSEVVPPGMSVWLDGAEQPIDDLVDVQDDRQRQASVLEGRGGIELLDEAAVEFNSERRHLAAQQVIQNQTPYTADIATPSYPTTEDADQQDPSTDAEFNALVSFDDDEPVRVNNNQIELQQSARTVEGEDTDGGGGADGTNAVSTYSDGSALVLDSITDVTNHPEYEWTPQYDIPAGEVRVHYRLQVRTNNQNPAFTIEINGEEVANIGSDILSDGISWRDTSDYSQSVNAGDTITVTFKVNSSGSDAVDLDMVHISDFRQSYNFDNSVDTANGHLDSPEEYPQNYEVEFDAATTPFSVIAGTVSVTMNDTSGDQRIQLRNEIGGTYKPDDGSEDNTTSVTVDPFANASDRIQFRVRLSRFGTRDGTTPQTGFDGQDLSAYDLDADIRQEALLLDYNEDKSVEEILNDIVGQSLVWSYRVDNGTKTVTVTQPGQRTSSVDADLIDATVTKDLDTVHEFTVRGSNKTVSGEEFSGSTTFQPLTEDDIIPASESVRDPTDGTQFTRTADYEMDWSAGEIRITDEGDMVDSTTYEISYRAETKATHTDPNAPTGFQSRTVDIPGVTSERNAEQIAFVLVNDLKAPRWVLDVTVPPGATDFDVIEALPLGSLDVPDSAGPFFATEPPRRTPRGIEFRLESAFDQERRVRQLQRQVSAVARRTG